MKWVIIVVVGVLSMIVPQAAMHAQETGASESAVFDQIEKIEQWIVAVTPESVQTGFQNTVGVIEEWRVKQYNRMEARDTVLSATLNEQDAQSLWRSSGENEEALQYVFIHGERSIVRAGAFIFSQALIFYTILLICIIVIIRGIMRRR